jgi:PilZ domain
MSNQGRVVENRVSAKLADLRKEGGLPVPDQSSGTEAPKNAGRYSDLQSAARFPIKLPISVKSKAGDSQTETENISANGVLFQMDSDMPVGSAVDFTISLPAEIMGTDEDVRVDCRGRVVRSVAEGPRVGVGVVIDEYHFERNGRSQEN